MYIQQMKSELFPIGEGSVQMSYHGMQYYLGQLQQLGTAEPPNISKEEIAIINSSKVPSHIEMVTKLAPTGNPDMIILAYWMPDLDTSVGNALVTTICATYNLNVNETLALSENGPGAIFSALEYAQQSFKKGKSKEIWLFFVNQFQGGSEEEGKIFWNEPGKGIWIRLSADAGDTKRPKISISRSPEGSHHGKEINLSDSWIQIAAKLDELNNLNIDERWQHRHHNEYSKLAIDIEATY